MSCHCHGDLARTAADDLTRRHIRVGVPDKPGLGALQPRSAQLSSAQRKLRSAQIRAGLPCSCVLALDWAARHEPLQHAAAWGSTLLGQVQPERRVSVGSGPHRRRPQLGGPLRLGHHQWGWEREPGWARPRPWAWAWGRKWERKWQWQWHRHPLRPRSGLPVCRRGPSRARCLPGMCEQPPSSLLNEPLDSLCLQSPVLPPRRFSTTRVRFHRADTYPRGTCNDSVANTSSATARLPAPAVLHHSPSVSMSPPDGDTRARAEAPPTTQTSGTHPRPLMPPMSPPLPGPTAALCCSGPPPPP